MNTDSALDVAYGATHRRIRLHHGEIMITTASDARPFLVDTPHGVIRALGTRFGVRCDAQGSTVSVYEHAVEVRCAARPDAVRRLEAGQQLRFSASGSEDVLAMPAHQDSWLRGMLVAADWPLQQLGRAGAFTGAGASRATRPWRGVPSRALTGSTISTPCWKACAPRTDCK